MHIHLSRLSQSLKHLLIFQRVVFIPHSLDFDFLSPTFPANTNNGSAFIDHFPDQFVHERDLVHLGVELPVDHQLVLGCRTLVFSSPRIDREDLVIVEKWLTQSRVSPFIVLADQLGLNSGTTGIWGLSLFPRLSTRGIPKSQPTIDVQTLVSVLLASIFQITLQLRDGRFISPVSQTTLTVLIELSNFHHFILVRFHLRTSRNR